MIELITAYNFSQVPYITYEALDNYAQQIVCDFAPKQLHNPGVLDEDKFLEYYLRLSVDYRSICCNKKVLGLTAFNDGFVEILDDETRKVVKLPVTAGTVIIDSSLDVKRNTACRRFTMLHEGSHWLLHRKTFSEDNPIASVGAYAERFLAAKEGRVDYSRSQKERNDIERMERQADFLASAILMPKPALRKVFGDFFKFYGEKPRRIIRGSTLLDDSYAKQLPEYIAGVFNVSKRAALIRLEKLTAIVDKGYGYYKQWEG